MRHTIAFLFVGIRYYCNKPIHDLNNWADRKVTWLAEGEGLDYASACARPYRSARRGPPPAPCDLTKHNYCSTPGNNYPWHAIRRFVKENQGLMKRMYGEERHIAVLKAELENFIEEDDDDDFKSSSFDEDIMKTKMKYTNHGRAKNMKPYFRPIQSTPAPLEKKKYDNDTLRVKPLQNKPAVTKVNSTEKENKTESLSNETTTEDKGISYKTKLESIANVEISNLDPDVITLEAVIKQSIETSSIDTNIQGTVKSNIANETTNIMERNKSTTTESVNSTETVTTEAPTTIDDVPTTESSKDGWKPVVSDTSTLPPTLLFSEHDKVKNDRVEAVQPEKIKEEFHLKPNHHQESLRPAVIKLRGANACESKEEMAAPFWANSTRGEVLALLNMYPFEQYIHLETCVHERKQMYCREGCRCEQQYRLHRLLAYDPRNECRGIFADWFKFPACCVCKCYDVPLEFRARSPRILRPKYDETLRRAILEDVAREWRASRYLDEDDDFY